MTLNRIFQIQEIRAKCVEANPEIERGCQCFPCRDSHEYANDKRPIRLADVLNAATKIGLYGGGIEKTDHEIIRRWYLDRDDLEAQSDETVAFIHSLLGGYAK